MALQGSSREEQIYNKLYVEYKNAYGVCGLMANIFAESGLNPKNLQNSFESKLKYSDESYTSAVDDGSYTNFIYDKAGYGLCQWTFWSRKQAMLKWHQSRNKSIGDLETQIEFLIHELSTTYKSVHSALKSATSVKQASNIVLHQFESPQDQSKAVEDRRASYGQTYYDKFASVKASSTQKGDSKMSNSSLVNVTMRSPNHSGKRTKSICRISPHCVVGQLTAEGIGNCFPSGRGASCNYGIGKDGRVVLVVDEANRSWCTSSNDNDQQAVTIECASDASAPYAFNNTVYNKLIDLCVDICKRNGKKKLVWIADKTKALAYKPASTEIQITVHRWFANKSCPGDWLMSRMNDLVAQVNKKLGSESSTPSGSTNVSSGTSSSQNKLPAAPFTVNVIIDDLNIRASASSNAASKGYTGKGTFTVTQVSNGWGKLKSGAGWIYLLNPSYCTIGKTTASAPSSKPAATKFPYSVRVDITDLRIRKGPGTNYAANGYTGKGTFTITEEASGKGAKLWGKLKSGAGWIALDHTTKI